MSKSVDAPTLTFGNKRVALKIDSETGFFRDIICKETGISHKGGTQYDIWPFGMRLGDSYSPDILRV